MAEFCALWRSKQHKQGVPARRVPCASNAAVACAPSMRSVAAWPCHAPSFPNDKRPHCPVVAVPCCARVGDDDAGTHEAQANFVQKPAEPQKDGPNALGDKWLRKRGRQGALLCDLRGVRHQLGGRRLVPACRLDQCPLRDRSSTRRVHEHHQPAGERTQHDKCKLRPRQRERLSALLA